MRGLTRIPKIRCVTWPTEVKQGKLVELIFQAKGNFRETYKSQKINPISPTPKFTLVIHQVVGDINSLNLLLHEGSNKSILRITDGDLLSQIAILWPFLVFGLLGGVIKDNKSPSVILNILLLDPSCSDPYDQSYISLLTSFQWLIQ